MGAIKLQKIGNSLGFRVPKDLLDDLQFDLSDEYELLSSENSLTIIKREPHNSEWSFKKTKLNSEDEEWLEANLGD